MSTQVNVSSSEAEDSRFFDGFTKTMLSGHVLPSPGHLCYWQIYVGP